MRIQLSKIWHRIVGPSSSVQKKPETLFSDKPLIPEIGKIRFFRYTADSRIEKYLNLTIEKIDNPSLKLAGILDRVVADLQGVIKDFTGKDLPQQEVIDHLGDRLEIVRDGERVVAFGTGKYFDFQSASGNKEKIALLFGTMVMKYYRRLGLMIKLNYDLIKAAEKDLVASTRGLFHQVLAFAQPTPIAVRTQSEGVWRACKRHFKGVVAVGQKPEGRYQEITSFIARKMAWPLDEYNIQKNAYESTRGEKLINGLHMHAAFVFSGDFSLLKRALTWIMVNIVYPLRYHSEKKTDNISIIC